MATTSNADRRRLASEPRPYARDSRAQVLRRLARMEGQVRGIARMIERDEDCLDVMQQTAALRAAVDSVTMLLMEDHVHGCLAAAATSGDGDAAGRRGHGRAAARHGPAGAGGAVSGWSPERRAAAGHARTWDAPLIHPPAPVVHSTVPGRTEVGG